MIRGFFPKRDMARLRKPRSTRTAKTASKKRSAAAPTVYDVIIVGAGPAGSTLASKLASQGVKTIILDGAKFPREKVCGDYVEPRGLRILDQMGGLKTLQATSPLPITHSATYVDSNREYIGKIPFYGVHKTLPACGYIVPRDVFDTLLLEIACRAGATIHQETYVTGFTSTASGVEVQAQSGGAKHTYLGSTIVGADGVNSVVARTAGLLVNDPRHVALSQRAYAEAFEGGLGEAAFFFDGDFFPGYGWMFPMSHGSVNCGVGILKETCQREGIAVPQLFRKFFEKLKTSHPRCANLKLSKPPIGGIVKTYGAAGPNYFDRGLLIGDAGSFVDPMTGEGITPAMESALIAAGVLLKALRSGRIDAETFSAYEQQYRGYFDPAMIFTDRCAAALRNPHHWGSWKNALIRGCELAQRDVTFAAKVGACFGGLQVEPAGILAEVMRKTAEILFAFGPTAASDLFRGEIGRVTSVLYQSADWMIDSWSSLWDDPLWHAGWALDVQRKWFQALALIGKGQADRRIDGIQ
jgi:geranylgeranyl reductase family protein